MEERQGNQLKRRDPLADPNRPYGMSLPEFWKLADDRMQRDRERILERQREQRWAEDQLGA